MKFIIIILLSGLTACSNNHWDGFVFLDKNKPEIFEKTKTYSNYENCRSGAWTLLLEANAVDTGYIECGLNCSESLAAKTGYSCEEIIRNR